MKRAMVETGFCSGIRMHADGAKGPIVALLGVLSPFTTTKKLGKTTR